jgi:hypothetical protein
MDPRRAAVLQQLVDEIEKPKNFHVKVAAGQTFEQAFGELLGWYRTRRRQLPPTFAFIDPFGWTGVPFALVSEILHSNNSEVFINFMYEEINRFLGQGHQPDNFDKFFGTTAWRDGLRLSSPRERNGFLHDLYLRQLREAAGARFVRSFRMANSTGVTDYYLFYATNELLGLKKMKAAMWKSDPGGEFTYSDATDATQLVLFGAEPRFDVLEMELCRRFRGSTVTVGDVESFVVAETAFRETHYKRVLKALEAMEPPRIRVLNPPAGRKRGTFASLGLQLLFLG